MQSDALIKLTPDKFIPDNVVAPFVPSSIVIVTLPFDYVD